MTKHIQYVMAAIAFTGLSVSIFSCAKDPVAQQAQPVPQVKTASFVEQFDNVGDLTGKGWVFVNNSNPVGQSGWRQGRYESASQMQYKFVAPVPYLGFPAYNASKSPNDFVSCDASCVNDALTGSGNISAWLISPSLPIKNGDSIVFYTRAVDDANYGAYCHDRMQVRANFTDGTADVGGSATSTGSFSNLLVDINPSYLRNDPAGNAGAGPGYPRVWTRVSIKFANIPGGAVTNGRFAFRYLGTNTGVWGGTNNENYPSVVGIDSLAFVHTN